MCCVRTPKEAVEEAEYCLEILDGRDLDYPVAYDMERKGTFAGGRENTTAIAKAFCDTIADAGYVPMIYSSASFLNENFDWKKLKNCKVWVASYSDTRPKLPVSADLWQYTKKGSLEGANTDKGYCDLVWGKDYPGDVRTVDIVIWSIPIWKQQVLSSRNPHLP